MSFVYFLIIVAGVVFFFYWLLSNKPSSGNVDQRISHIQSQQSSHNNKWAAGHAAATAKRRAEHTENLTREANAVYDLDAVPIRKEREEHLLKKVHDVQISALKEAERQKITLPTYEALKLIEGTAQVEITKAQALKDIEWEYLEREHNLQLRGAILLAIKRQKELEGLMELYEASHERFMR